MKIDQDSGAILQFHRIDHGCADGWLQSERGDAWDDMLRRGLTSRSLFVRTAWGLPRSTAQTLIKKSKLVLLANEIGLRLCCDATLDQAALDATAEAR